VRRLFPLAALAAGAILLSACGGGDNPTIATDSGAEAGHEMTGSSSQSGMAMNDTNMGSMPGHDEASGVEAGAREVPVTASSFRFEPAEIRARAGEKLAIALTATDILHDFTIDELDAHVAAEPGQTAKGGVTAVKPGRYAYYCTVAGHRQAGMEGVLIVE
jgi:plastocyanin